jgi:L-galactono-1,4-lactone dehydrogenase
MRTLLPLLCVLHTARFDCVEHWAKLEMPRSEQEARDIQARLRKRYPVDEFNAVRHFLDPKNIMANEHIDAVFGTGSWASDSKEE